MQKFYRSKFFTLAFCWLVFGIVPAFSQDVTIKGIVKDSDGMTLPGATVGVKGTSLGAITDLDGRFSLEVPNLDQTLVVSFVGYQTSEVAVGGRSQIDVVLQFDISSLEEIVVVGYGSTARKDLTTSIAKVEIDDVPKAANSSVPEMLFGRAAGLQTVQNSSEPGGSINLSIRGGATPLIVIDGVIMPTSGNEPGNGNYTFNGVNRGGLAGLNPDDIASVEVLKDASAAIYGVNAANGVILITTKDGKAGQMDITYNASRSHVQNMPYLQPLNAQEYKKYISELGRDRFLFQNDMIPFGDVSPTPYTAPFSPAEINNTGVGTDWLGEVLRDGSIDNHSLTINGGTELVNYYFSGNYFDQVGTVNNSGLTRYSGRANLKFSLSDRISLNTSINASRNFYGNSTAGVQSGGGGSQGYGAVQAALAYPSTLDIKDENGDFTRFALTGNPVSLLDIEDQTQATALLSNLSLDVDLVPDLLTAKLIYGNNHEISKRDFYIPSTTFYNQLNQSRGSLSDQQRDFHTLEAVFTLNKDLGQNISLDAVAGVGRYLEQSQGFGLQYSNSSGTHDGVRNTNVAASDGPRIIFSNKFEEERRSAFARTNFDFFDRYLLSLSYRYDGVDKFHEGNKFAGFPSVSVGWKLSNESFMSGIKAIDLLKIRASYGVLGDENAVSANTLYRVFGPDGSTIPFNSTNLITPYVLQGINWPNLTWPKTIVKNIAIDFDLFKGRVNGSIDFFQKDITQILRTIPAAPLSFLAQVPVNDGHQVNRGMDFSINSINIQSKDFEWSTTLNASRFETRWKSYADGEVLAPFQKENDYVGAIYVYETENRLLQIGEEAPAQQPLRARYPGSPIFLDQNGDDTLTVDDIVMISPFPKLYLGLGNTFRYRQFELTVFAYGRFGFEKRNYARDWTNMPNFLGGLQSSTTDMSQVWSTTNPDGTLPGYAYDEFALGLPVQSDYLLEDASFIRVRNITLGYTFKRNAIAFMDNLRVYADVQNPFIFSSFEGIDPETSQGGGVRGGPGNYPMVRTYSLGFNANF